jgi:hypothetical protein
MRGAAGTRTDRGQMPASSRAPTTCSDTPRVAQPTGIPAKGQDRSESALSPLRATHPCSMLSILYSDKAFQIMALSEARAHNEKRGHTSVPPGRKRVA